MLVQEALKQGGNLRLIAEDAGVSYKAVLAWNAGARTPQPDSLQRLAEGFRRRASQMVEAAAKLEKAARTSTTAEGDGGV